jgi:hypothetical protein
MKIGSMEIEENILDCNIGCNNMQYWIDVRHNLCNENSTQSSKGIYFLR